MQADQVWQAALGALSRQVPRRDFDTWLRSSSIVDFADGAIIVAMPNSFAVKWIESRHAALVQRVLSELVGYLVPVRFAVREGAGYFIPGAGPTQAPARPSDPPQTSAAMNVTSPSPTVGGKTATGNGAGPAIQRERSASAAPHEQNKPEVQAVMPFYNTPGKTTVQQGSSLEENKERNGTSPLAPDYANGAQQPVNNTSSSRFNALNNREVPSLDEQIADGTPLNPRYLFEHFIVGSSNRMAHAASVAVADNPAHAYNPLFLYGGVGLGKTHLLHAIGHHAKAKFPGIRIMYISSETFTNDLINAIRDGTNEDFRSRYRSIDILMIDDIQFIAGKESTQEEFFHTFNALHGAGRQIVISSDRPPKAILTLDDRIRSRFEGGLIADVQQPDVETRIAILRTKSDSAQIPVPSEVIDYVAHKIQSNIRELEGALNRLIAFAMLNQKPLTVEVASLALSDLTTNSRRRSITPSRVVEMVATFFNIDVAELKGPKRQRDITVPRQIAMYIIREETDASLTDIGIEFGNRDHTTVMHACEKIEKAREVDNQIRQSILAIRQMLYGELSN